MQFTPCTTPSLDGISAAVKRMILLSLEMTPLPAEAVQLSLQGLDIGPHSGVERIQVGAFQVFHTLDCR